MWKRIELHNHTIESDGTMTVQELVRYLELQGIHAFSLTDHNTVSGFPGLTMACDSQASPMEYINGFELTSYYGHLLCQNVSAYIPWDDIDKDFADSLFQRVHEAGGLAGPAHPFSLPFPFSNGMRWSMNIHDYHLIDFIEVINNAHPMSPDNQEAILWWESLVFSVTASVRFPAWTYTVRSPWTAFIPPASRWRNKRRLFPFPSSWIMGSVPAPPASPGDRCLTGNETGPD
ncbi:CehA/McbA family metallohydrolase [Lachnospiraceae bacterium 54-53]